MRVILPALLLLSTLIASSAFAKRTTVRILDDRKIRVVFKNDKPEISKKLGIFTDTTGFLIEDGKFVPAFSFWTNKKYKLQKVVVENVMGLEPVMVASDESPELADNRWVGRGTPLKMSKENAPWIYDEGESLIIFRYNVTILGRKRPLMIYQAALFSASTKKMLRGLAEK